MGCRVRARWICAGRATVDLNGSCLALRMHCTCASTEPTARARCSMCLRGAHAARRMRGHVPAASTEPTACSLQPVQQAALARCACCTANARSCSHCEHGAHCVLAATCAAGCACAVLMLHGECAVMFPRLDRCPRADPKSLRLAPAGEPCSPFERWGTPHCQALWGTPHCQAL